jgi:hypothetical protein
MWSLASAGRARTHSAITHSARTKRCTPIGLELIIFRSTLFKNARLRLLQPLADRANP